MAKKPMSPLRAALYVLLLAVLVGGLATALFLPAQRGKSHFDNGEAAGRLVGGPAIGLSILTYVVMQLRKKRDDA